MSDRTRHLVVYLDDEYRTDSLDELCAAIRFMKAVSSVKPGNSDDINGDCRYNVDAALREGRTKAVSVLNDVFYEMIGRL
jgi:hypothetical protein